MSSLERGVEAYKNFNKLTLAGALSIALIGAYFAPVLIAPALTLATFDAAQLFVINKLQGSAGKSKK